MHLASAAAVSEMPNDSAAAQSFIKITVLCSESHLSVFILLYKQLLMFHHDFIIICSVMALTYMGQIQAGCELLVHRQSPTHTSSTEENRSLALNKVTWFTW